MAVGFCSMNVMGDLDYHTVYNQLKCGKNLLFNEDNVPSEFREKY